MSTQSGALCRQFWAGALRSKLKLELYVNTFDLGALMSKNKVAIYVDKLKVFGPSSVLCSVDIGTLHFSVDIIISPLYINNLIFITTW